MRVLIAEDEVVTRRMLELSLIKWGYEVVMATDGREAWNLLEGEGAPALCVLDWLMPGMDGVEICRKLRENQNRQPTYIILLTAKGDKEDLIRGLESGADDYMRKPFDAGELRARVQVGERVLELQSRLARNIQELQEALNSIKQLQGLLPICSYCKKIRDDKNYWHKVENYIGEHSEVRFSHGVCPDCTEKLKAELGAA